MICIRTYARAKNVAVYLCAACSRMFIAFDYENARAFSYRDTVTVVKRRALFFREGVKRVKTRISKRLKTVAAACDEDVRLA